MYVYIYIYVCVYVYIYIDRYACIYRVCVLRSIQPRRRPEHTRLSESGVEAGGWSGQYV